MRTSWLTLRSRNVPPNLKLSRQLKKDRAHKKHLQNIGKLISFANMYDVRLTHEKWWVQSEWEHQTASWDMDHSNQRRLRKNTTPPALFDMAYSCRIKLSFCGLKLIICPWCKSTFRLICDGYRCEFFVHVATNHTFIFEHEVVSDRVEEVVCGDVDTPYGLKILTLMKRAWAADFRRGVFEEGRESLRLPLLIVKRGDRKFNICPYCRYHVIDYLLHYFRFHITFYGECPLKSGLEAPNFLDVGLA